MTTTSPRTAAPTTSPRTSATPAPTTAPHATPAPSPSPDVPAPDVPAPADAGAARTGTEWTGARTEEAAGRIAGARERIDVLDDRIIGLVHERMAVSAVIQEARIASGGRRVNLAREMEVLGHFREALGKPGTALAMTLLELCRGRI
ncbi:chorismate mutase [Streptomyces sp. NPDC014894]|uniref:chorismate mutase n=1 Tax=unclassified Streptomyces TaxID=2593676 RepID=UPI0036FC247A